MINKINKVRRRLINATPYDPANEPVARNPGGPQTKTEQGTDS
jgi:hypothetical protein